MISRFYFYIFWLGSLSSSKAKKRPSLDDARLEAETMGSSVAAEAATVCTHEPPERLDRSTKCSHRR
jgi:hypothetical protein